MARKRTDALIDRLKGAYPAGTRLLRFKTPYQLLIATILSAQCTDARANEVSRRLFKKYKNAAGFSKAARRVLEREVYSTGFYKNKAKNIISASRQIIRDYKGRLPRRMEELVRLAGVGRKTANIVLSAAFRKAEGIAVDTHVKRISRRLGLSVHTNPDMVERDLLAVIPRRHWLDFNYLLVNHGRAVCRAQRPLCPECVLGRLCPKIGVG